MNILITGSNGFIGKNLIAELKNRGYSSIYEFDIDTDKNLLPEYLSKCDFIFHLAGVNRPQNENEFMEGNFGFTDSLLDILKSKNNKAPIVITSSSQALLDNPYGKSKKAGEDLIFSYGREYGVKTCVYRLSNVFGKWCRPNYNSVVATFCDSIANDKEIVINNSETLMKLHYIDDVVDEFIKAMNNNENKKDDGFCYVEKTYEIKLGELAKKLYDFNANRSTLVMPPLKTEFDRALYGTFLSYLPQKEFGYELNMKHDQRGWLAEFIKSKSMGQIFISKTKPGITRGNHWHHTKVEKFLVVQGQAVISFRKIGNDEVIEYNVDGENLKVLDIPVGYTHAIKNTGTDDVITLFWADEIFNPEKPDTYYLEV